MNQQFNREINDQFQRLLDYINSVHKGSTGEMRPPPVSLRTNNPFVKLIADIAIKIPDQPTRLYSVISDFSKGGKICCVPILNKGN